MTHTFQGEKTPYLPQTCKVFLIITHSRIPAVLLIYMSVYGIPSHLYRIPSPRTQKLQSRKQVARSENVHKVETR